MKKLLFSFTALLGFGVAFAQTPSYDLSVELVQPAASATITSGQSFTIEVNVNNAGPDAIPVGDTIGVVPLIGGQPFQNQQGQPFVFATILQSPIPANGSISFDNNFTVTGTQSGSLTLCAELFAVLGNASGGELDSSNWVDCNSVNFQGGGTTSVNEYKLSVTEDNSYYADGIFYFDVTSINGDAARMNYDLVNVAGQTIISGQLPINVSSVKGQVEIPQVPTGVYIMRMSAGQQFNATKKIMIAQ